tara:strand:- start:317 stop:460 length:144 start_codon:yes stop_codon:yes gene_type:complete
LTDKKSLSFLAAKGNNKYNAGHKIASFGLVKSKAALVGGHSNSSELV